jgi:hypothetical protein
MSASESLNDQQKKFCELYAYSNMRGNGVQCYLEAYDTDKDSPITYASARTGASRLLTDVDILSYIRELYEEGDLNDTIVDNELAFLIKQSADFGSKLGAIKEYNALKSRVKNKLDLTTNGKDLSGIQIYIPDNGRDKTTEGVSGESSL